MANNEDNSMQELLNKWSKDQSQRKAAANKRNNNQTRQWPKQKQSHQHQHQLSGTTVMHLGASKTNGTKAETYNDQDRAPKKKREKKCVSICFVIKI